MVDIVQGSDAWHMMRLGKVTASRVADVIARTKTGYSASRANYAAQLITERLTLTPTEGFTNAAMQWGTDKEPEARSEYEFYRAEEVEQVYRAVIEQGERRKAVADNDLRRIVDRLRVGAGSTPMMT